MTTEETANANREKGYQVRILIERITIEAEKKLGLLDAIFLISN